MLPLANIFGQFEMAVGLVFGWRTCFATRIDRLETELSEVQPSILFGVPKLFERCVPLGNDAVVIACEQTNYPAQGNRVLAFRVDASGANLFPGGRHCA